MFITNDSTDGTSSLLRDWGHSQKQTVILDFTGIVQALPERTVRLACLRNMYLQELRKEATMGISYDLLIIADLDGVNDQISVGQDFERAIGGAPNDWGAVFPNQTGAYYDVWALRHASWSPNDCWHQIEEEKGRFFPRRRDRLIKKHVRSRQVKIYSYERPIQVDSAFGGFGIYRTKYLDGAWYGGLTSSGVIVCEHVTFNSLVKRNGARLYILPTLQNEAPSEHLGDGAGAPRRPWS
jgi:hypothetical protein